MKLSELLTPQLVLRGMQAPDKWDAIRQLAEVPVAAGFYDAKALPGIHDALVERERSMTTGMEQGLAIPHAAVDGLENVLAVLGLAPEGIPFETVDGKPATILVCLVIPRAKKLLHIKTLAEIVRLLDRASVREAVLQCGSADEVIDTLRRAESA